MRTARLIKILFTCLFLLIPAFVSAQSNGLGESIASARLACRDVTSDRLCYGAGAVQATSFAGDAIDLSEPGAVADLNTIATLTSEANGISIMRLPAGLDPLNGGFVTMALVGEAELSNGFDAELKFATCNIANQNPASVDVFARPNTQSDILGKLDPIIKVTANGRFNDARNRWFRIAFNGELGWVINQNIAIDCEPDTLTEVSQTDVDILYNFPMQSLTLTSTEPASGLLARGPLGQQARLRINNYQVLFSGTVFIQGEADSVTLSVLNGQAAFITQGAVLPVSGGASVNTITGDVAQSDDDFTDLSDLANRLLGGQPLDSPTITGFTAEIAEQAADSDLIRVDLHFTATAASCAVEVLTPLSVVFLVDFSPTLADGPIASDADLGAMRQAVAAGISALNLRTDQVAVIGFRDTASTIMPLSRIFDPDVFSRSFTSAAADFIQSEAELLSNPQVGFSRAISALKGADPSARRFIVYLTDGQPAGDDLAGLLDEAASQNITINAVSYGSAEADLSGIGTTVRRAPTALTLASVVESLIIEQVRAPGAVDFELSYTPADGYTFVQDFLAISGGVLEGEVAVWRIPAIGDGQRVNFPILLTGSGGDEPGIAQINYTLCGPGGESVSSGEMAVPAVVQLDNGPVSARQGILSLGQTGPGAIARFGAGIWAVDTGEATTFAIVTADANQGLLPVLGDGIAPLFTLDNFDSQGRNLSVFAVEQPGVYPLTVLSTASTAAGDYRVSLSDDLFDGALVSLLPGSGNVPDQQVNDEGRIYAVDGVGAGDIITVRVRTRDNDQSPVQLVSLDGQPATEVYVRYDEAREEWQSVQAVTGAGPYRLIIRTDGQYGVDILAGDTVTLPQGSLEVGDRINQRLANENLLPVSYTLSLASDQVVSLNLSGGVTSTIVRDAQNQLIRPLERISINRFALDVYDLPAGDYTVYLEVGGTYSVGLVAGTIAESLKGVINLGVAVNSPSSFEAPVSVYNIVPGAGKPFFENDLISISLSNTIGSPDSVFIENEIGEIAEVVNQYADDQNELFIGVYRMVGPGPYRVITRGLQEFHTLSVNRGDLLTNDKGAIQAGQSLRDSSNAPQSLIYTLAPQFGKSLGEGDIITIRFSNTVRDFNIPFILPVLEDAKGNRITRRSTINPLGTRDFGATYELVGQGPYRLLIDNIGAYTLAFDVGDTLTLNQGELGRDTTVNGTASGLQNVTYTITAEAGDSFTFTLQSQDRNFIVGNVRMFWEDGFGFFNGIIRTANNRILTVFSFERAGTYTFSFPMRGAYELQVVPRDELNIDGGEFFIGDADSITNEDFFNKRVNYTLNITEPGQKLTIDSTFNFTLIDFNGAVVQPETEFTVYERQRLVSFRRAFTLRETGRYRLILSPTRAYRLSVTPTDELTVVKGNAFYNITENDRLDNNQRYAVYNLPGQPGDNVTVVLAQQRVRQSRLLLDLQTITIFDANGVPVSSVRDLSDEGYLLRHYRLRGPAPYTLRIQPQRVGRFAEFFWSFTPQEAYRLTVLPGDVSFIDEGFLFVGDEGQDEFDVAFGMRTLRFPLEALTSGPVTIELTSDNIRYHRSLELRDPQGNLMEGVANFSNNRTSRYTYQLPADGTYTLTFNMSGRYSFRIIGEDLQNIDFGEAVVNPLDPPPVITTDAQGNTREEPYTPVSYSNRFNQTQIAGAYQFTADPGSVVSVSLQLALNEDPLLVSADGVVNFPFDLGGDQRTRVFVYELAGQAPYRLSFIANTNSSHTLRLDEGNVLIAELGAVVFNPANPEPEIDDRGNEVIPPPVVTEGSLSAPARIGIFDIPGAEGDVVTLRLEQRGNTPPDSVIINGVFELIVPDYSIVNRGVVTALVRLTGPGPYRLYFAPTANYNITAFDGDAIISPAGPLPVGLREENYTNTLTGTALIAEHTIDVATGRFVTLQLNNQRRPMNVLLFSADGELVEPQIYEFQNRTTNIYVYLLSGTGPFTARFEAQGEYEVVVQEGNLYRVDRGLVDFGETIVDDIPDPGRIVSLSVNGKADQFVTINVQDSGRPVAPEFRDANGKLWDPILSVVQNNRTYNLYQLGGPSPYQIVFPTDREFNIIVEDGNTLRSELGDIILGERTRGRLEAPSRTAVYTVPVRAGQFITVQLQDNNRPVMPRFLASDDTQLNPDLTVVQNNAMFVLYAVAGPPPYRLEFESSGNYDLTVTPDNILLSDLGFLEIGTRTNNTLRSPSRFAQYYFDGRPGAIVSVAVQVAGRPSNVVLGDAEENVIDAIVSVDKNNIRYLVYELKGEGPYQILFESPGAHNITVSNGNVLRADLGLIRFGNTVTDRLTAPEDVAVYRIDATEGQTITVRVSDNNRPIDSELISADGILQVAWGQARTQNSTFSTYTLIGQGPFTLTFQPRGNYSLELQRGNTFRAELGTVFFGQEVRNRVNEPVSIAAYTINTAAEQVISIRVTNSRREYILPKLFNAEGEELIAQTQVFNNNTTFVGVYTLRGNAPYTLEFPVVPRVEYRLEMTRGDITVVEAPDVGPQSIDQNRLPGERPRR